MLQPELAIGIGMRRGATAESIVAAVRDVAADARIACLATIDRRAAEPGLTAAAKQLGVRVIAYTPAQLTEVAVPNPSDRTALALGTASVCEAAALLAARSGELRIHKRKVAGITVAAAVIRRAVP
ncbi:cobalamin biosynthesis protein [Nocardia sp. NPDC057668]|uniref:cobalamin biosynthesis protein n=1 Tax=Nocardia sp. NPDC057668 TaxID=3346202 RepID=UPI0036702539